MKEYRHISDLRFGLGYLPAFILGSAIYWYGYFSGNIWVAWGGLISLIVLIVATTFVWQKVLRLPVSMPEARLRR